MPKYLEIIHDDCDALPTMVTYETPISTPWCTDNMTVQSDADDGSPTLGRSSAAGAAMLSNASTTDDNRSTPQITDYDDAPLIGKNGMRLVASMATAAIPQLLPQMDTKHSLKKANVILASSARSSSSTDLSNDTIEKHLLHKSYVNSNLENAIRSCDGITSM